MMLPPRLDVYHWPHVTLTFDLTRKVALFNTCANWHQNWFSLFQSIMFTSLATDEQMDNLRTSCLCLLVWPVGDIKK